HVHVERLPVDAHELGADGRFDQNSFTLPWTTPTVGWDIADLDGSGRTDLVLVEDGRTVTRRRFEAGTGWRDPETLFENEIYQPSGVARVPFARDVDADGQLDLVLPGPGRFYVHRNLGSKDGVPRFADALEVAYEPDIDYEFGDPTRLSSTFGQTVDVPLFTMRDVDGDGTKDLVSEVGTTVSFHLARPEISVQPTWSLDLSKYRTSDDISASDFDLDDVLSAVSGLAEWEIADLDGAFPNDLVLGAGGRFQVFLGAASEGPAAKPDQVLKASGNVLRFFVSNVVGDARPDLQVLRGERISLGRLLRFLIVPGKLDFDVYTYGNENGQFARRATQRQTLALRVPRLLTMLDKAEDLGDAVEELWDIPARRIDWDGDGRANDVVDERAGRLVVVRDCAPEEPHEFEGLTMQSGFDSLIQSVVLRKVRDLGDGEEVVLDLGDPTSFLSPPAKAFRDAAAGKEPAASHALFEGNDDRSLRALDLDGDGRVDFITVVDGESTFRVQFLVRRARG
ncbi:MAG: hypothetical protein AAFP22_09870, partial [Planctomycetota bacterium]